MKTNIFKLFVLIFILSASLVQAQWTEKTHSAGTYIEDLRGQEYGRSVAMDGNYAVVGAPEHKDKGCAYILYYNGNKWVTKAKLVTSDVQRDNIFGISVAIEGDYIVVGAIGNSQRGSFSGAAYVFVKPASGWKDATETAKLTASDGEADALFGSSIAIYGENIAIGAKRAVHNGVKTGAAYVFTKPSLGWEDNTETAKLTPTGESEDANFGTAIAISETTVLVGADQSTKNGSNSGAAYLFERPASGWSTMTPTAELTSTNIADNHLFGHAVALQNDVAVISAIYEDYVGFDDGGGAVYVYEKPVSGWTSSAETARLIASDIDNSVIFFGSAVSVENDIILIGAHGDELNGPRSGSVYLFEKPVSGWEDGNEFAKFRASDGIDFNFFGRTVAMSGDHFIVGAFGNDESYEYGGAAYTFSKPATGWVNSTENAKHVELPQYLDFKYSSYFNTVATDGLYSVLGIVSENQNTGCAYVLFFNGINWEVQGKLTASDGANGDLFGSSVSIHGEYISIGASNNGDKGAAYVYEKPASGWEDMTQTAKLTASDGNAEDRFGHAIAIHGESLAVGAYWNAESDIHKGAVYVFQMPANGWENSNESAKLTASDGTTEDFFGFSVDLHGDIVAVGAFGSNAMGARSGAAYVFEKPGAEWANMVETAKLTASDGRATSLLGYSVATNGTVVAAGAYLDEMKKFLEGGNSGSVYIFEKPASGWTDMTQIAKLKAKDAERNTQFGKAIDMQEDLIVVGAEDLDNNLLTTGTLYLFEKPVSGWVDGTQTETLKSAVATEKFGYSVSITEDHVVATGGFKPANTNINSSAAFLFSTGPIITNLKEHNPKIALYPNPSKHSITIEEKGQVTVEILDLYGNSLIKTNKKRIDLSALPPAMYFVAIKTTTGQTKMERLIKN